MYTTELRNRKLLQRILLAILVFLVLFLMAMMRMRMHSEDFRNIDNMIHIDIIRSNGAIEHYPSGTVDAIHKGDQFVIYADDVSELKSGSALVFSIYNSEVRVYSDDSLLYADYYDDVKDYQPIGDRWYAVSLPDTSDCQDLRIEGTMVRNGTISLFSELRILPAISSWKSILSGNEFMFLIFSTVVIASGVLLIFFILTSFHDRQVRMGMWIALFSFVICNWFLGYKLFFYIISDDIHLNANIEYVSFFAIGAPFSFFMYHHLHKELYKKISFGFGVLFTVIFAVSTVINYSPILMNYCDLLPYCRTILALSLLFFGVAVFTDTNEDMEGATANHIIKWGVVAAIAVAVFALLQAQVAAANITERLKGEQVDLVPVAILAIITALYVSVFSRYVQETMTKMEADQLKAIAFIDPLTGAENRSALYSHLNDLSLRNQKDYVIVFLDVNDLKVTNDKYGHAIGDELIAAAANLIRQSFREGTRGFCGRWGGDEFLACVYGSEADAKTCINRFYQNLDEFNKAGKLPFRMTVSSGYAVSTTEKPVDYETAIKQADEAMYIDKKKFKELHGLATAR